MTATCWHKLLSVPRQLTESQCATLPAGMPPRASLCMVQGPTQPSSYLCCVRLVLLQKRLSAPSTLGKLTPLRV
jgi:hypothetical protein